MATTTTNAAAAKTNPAPAVIPAITSEPAYSKALKKQADLHGTLRDLCDERRRVQTELSKLAAGPEGGHGVTALELKLDAFLSEDGDEDALDESRVSLATALRDLDEKIEFLSAAIKRHQQTDVAPAKAAAQKKHIRAVFENVWKPAVREILKLRAEYHKGMSELLDLASRIEDAELWIHPVTIPLNESRGTQANDHLDEVETLLRAAVGEGYFTPAEARTLLPGVKF